MTIAAPINVPVIMPIIMIFRLLLLGNKNIMTKSAQNRRLAFSGSETLRPNLILLSRFYQLLPSTSHFKFQGMIGRA